MANAKFTVDTHLFRELGELLVGRNSTALIELIKNAYDADATHVTVDGKSLSDPKRGAIVVIDDGIGMNEDHFRSGFLRIASRMKEGGNRKSLRFERRYTGAKGIGRLAAHKLAKCISVSSSPDPEFISDSANSIEASIDWEIIENCFTFDDVEGSGAIELQTTPTGATRKPGTVVRLTRLRKKWTPNDLVQFQAEVESFRPPDVFLDIPEGLIVGDHLFVRPKVADVGNGDPGVAFKLTGEFDTGESYWPMLSKSAEWLIEIDADNPTKAPRVAVSPTKQGMAKFPDAAAQQFEIKRGQELPQFQARIYVREGNRGGRTFQSWMKQACGIRVYFEGFRVLPYGEAKNDWLELDADYKSRSRALLLLTEKGFKPPADDPDEGLVFIGNSAFFGGVFLTADGAPSLKMLVNREGFVSGTSFDSLVAALRTAIQLSVRVRAAAKKTQRQERRAQRQQGNDDKRDEVVSRLELRQAVGVTVEKAAGLAREAKALAAAGNVSAAAHKINEAATEFSRGAEVSERLMTEGTTIRIMASVGTQLAAFVHEIRSILGLAQALEAAVSEISESFKLSAAHRRRLAQLRVSLADLRRGIERQASYLVDIVSPDARRRRTRQKLAERFDTGTHLISAAATRRNVTIENDIPADLKSPPMFPAELTVIFSNLLTNAVKAAGERGRIRATGELDDQGRTHIRVENSGTAVELKNAERWFRPFESTTTELDPVLGQGMGMGLPITRNLLEEYGARIESKWWNV